MQQMRFRTATQNIIMSQYIIDLNVMSWKVAQIIIHRFKSDISKWFVDIPQVMTNLTG